MSPGGGQQPALSQLSDPVPGRHLSSDQYVAESANMPKVFSATSISSYLEARVPSDSRETRSVRGCFPQPTVFLSMSGKRVNSMDEAISSMAMMLVKPIELAFSETYRVLRIRRYPS